MSTWTDTLTTFISAHPHWAGVFVFLVAASEAIVLIGYVIPGTAILLTVGGIAGLGHLPLLPILAWAAARAVVGDGFSYRLGRTYQEGLRRQWPFSRYPRLIDRGEAFFQRHGAKSVFLGRFVPVLKPIIPTVAGILGMPPIRFYISNVISAIFWSPAHILPGVLVGVSLGVLHGVSARLLLVVLAVLLVAGLSIWSGRLVVLWLAPTLARAHRRVFEWAMRRPGTLACRLASPFDPDHPATPGLVIALGALVAAALAFAGVLEDVVTRDRLVVADRAISHFVTGLRNDWTDPVMITVTALGDSAVTMPLIITVIVWLLALRVWRLAVTVALALGAAGLAVAGLKALVQMPRPETMYSGIDAFAFPSGHTTMAVVLFGLAAWVVAGGAGPAVRGFAYAASFAWVLIMATSRIYLGAHWPSDVLGGLLLGTGICASVSILCRHAPRAHVHPGWLGGTFAVVLLAAGTWHVSSTYDAQVQRYGTRSSARIIDPRQWWQAGQTDLPRHRVDLAGESEEPLVLQWFGTAATLRERLQDSGWTHPVAWSLATAAGFLKPSTSLDALPMVPRLHDGAGPVVTLVRGPRVADSRWVFQAWESGFEGMVGDRRVPFLVGSIVRERMSHPGDMLSLSIRDVAGTPDAIAMKGVQSRRLSTIDGAQILLAAERQPERP